MRDRYGIGCVVAINHRAEDTDAEMRAVIERAAHLGVKVMLARHFAQGGRGAVEVAEEVVRLCAAPNDFKFVYEESATPLGEDESHRDTHLRRGRYQRLERRARADRAAAE